MKANYLIFTAVVSIFLTSGVNILIIKWNFNSFTQSEYHKIYKEKASELEYKLYSLPTESGFKAKHSLERIKEMTVELHNYGDQLLVKWFDENKIIIHLRFLIPIFVFLLFISSFLNIKYSDQYKTFEILREAFKYKFFSIIVLVYILILVSNLIICKKGMLYLSHLNDAISI